MNLENEVLQKDFDLNKYLGDWYEIAKIPTPFQSQCPRSLATYEPLLLQEKSGTSTDSFSVLNTCLNRDGQEIDSISGLGKVYDPEYPAAITVSFPSVPQPQSDFPNYLVHYTDYDHFAVVGSPDRKLLYILSRTPSISSEAYYNLASMVYDLGYDTSKLQLDFGSIREDCDHKDSDTDTDTDSGTDDNSSNSAGQSSGFLMLILMLIVIALAVIIIFSCKV